MMSATARLFAGKENNKHCSGGGCEETTGQRESCACTRYQMRQNRLSLNSWDQRKARWASHSGDRSGRRILYAHDWGARSPAVARSDGYRADASHKGYEVMPCKEGTESFSVDANMQLAVFQVVMRWSFARLDNV